MVMVTAVSAYLAWLTRLDLVKLEWLRCELAPDDSAHKDLAHEDSGHVVLNTSHKPHHVRSTIREYILPCRYLDDIAMWYLSRYLTIMPNWCTISWPLWETRSCVPSYLWRQSVSLVSKCNHKLGKQSKWNKSTRINSYRSGSPNSKSLRYRIYRVYSARYLDTIYRLLECP